MRERRALGILSAETHGHSIRKQRRERQCLGVPPVDATGIAHGIGATRQSLGEPRIHFQRRWPPQKPLVQGPQTIGVYRRVAAARARLIGLGVLAGFYPGSMDLPTLLPCKNPVEFRRGFGSDLFNLLVG